MNKYSLIGLLLLVSCGTDDITEVGNPTGTTPPKAATTTSGAVTSLNNGATKFFNSIAGGGSQAQLRLDDPEHVEVEGEFSCTFDSFSGRGTCSCPGGGSMTHLLESTVNSGLGSITFNQTSTVNYADCILTTCSTEITLNGETTGSIEGTATRSDEDIQLDLVMSQSTKERCGGIEIGEAEMGYNISITFDGQNRSFSGTICINDSEYTFDNLAELERLVDPDSTCSGDFGPSVQSINTDD